MLYQIPLFLWLIYLGYVDLKTRRIPNSASITLFFAALLCQVSDQAPTLLAVAANLVLGLSLTLPGYFRGIVGGGDVKLMMALSPAWSPFFLFGSFAVGVLITSAAVFIQSRTHKGVAQAGSANLPLATCMASGAVLLLISLTAKTTLL